MCRESTSFCLWTEVQEVRKRERSLRGTSLAGKVLQVRQGGQASGPGSSMEVKETFMCINAVPHHPPPPYVTHIYPVCGICAHFTEKQTETSEPNQQSLEVKPCFDLRSCWFWIPHPCFWYEASLCPSRYLGGQLSSPVLVGYKSLMASNLSYLL